MTQQFEQFELSAGPFPKGVASISFPTTQTYSDGEVVDWDADGDGAAIDPASRYRVDPEYGARRVLSERGGERSRAATGRALLALAADETPDPEDLPGLRRVLRDVLAHHLGARGLKSWELMADLGRLSGSDPLPASTRAAD